MRHQKTLNHPTFEKPTTTVSVGNYKRLLNNAGFCNHKDLTGKDLELNEIVMVKSSALGDAYRALETKKKEEKFEIFHHSNDDLRKGVKKLTEFLNHYKDCR